MGSASDPAPKALLRAAKKNPVDNPHIRMPVKPSMGPSIRHGLRAMIGKGKRSPEVLAALQQYKAVYLGATGGAGALISQCIKKAEVVAFPELGPEAVHRLEVENLPTIVINDCQGRDLYEVGIKEYRRTADTVIEPAACR